MNQTQTQQDPHIHLPAYHYCQRVSHFCNDIQKKNANFLSLTGLEDITTSSWRLLRQLLLPLKLPASLESSKSLAGYTGSSEVFHE